LLRLGGLTAAGLALTGPEARALAAPSATQAPIDADESLRLLFEGNQRWAAGTVTRPNQSTATRSELATGQQPFAVVFSCVDSRVPPELVFDRGLGDLLVIRTAGHVLDQAALGSIEFGVEELHIPLVLVLGHQRCGAVSAAVEAVEHDLAAPGQIGALVEGIRPAVEVAEHESGDIVDASVRANIELVVETLRNAAPILSEGVDHGSLRVVGAYYDLNSGLVELTAP
jgi:carbonic anhydrase